MRSPCFSLRLALSFSIILLAQSVLAQQQPEEDKVPEREDRKSYHYLGLQGNQLLRQLFSFGGSPSAVVNPYLFTYSVNSKSSGFGFTTGLGASKIQSKSTDNFTTTTSTITDFTWRVGLEKKTYLSRRWLVGWGGDILLETNKAETVSKSGNNPGNTITTTAKRYGFGPRVSLAFHVHDRILLGTEASYYFKWIKQKQTLTGTGFPTPATNEPNPSLQQFQFTLPAVIFVMVKL